MNGKKVAANLAANIIFAVLLVAALLAAQVIYQVIASTGTMSESVMSLLIASAVFFLPLTWVVNKFIVKPDWSDTFAKIVLRQAVLLGLFFVFVVVAIIVGSMNRVDLAEPIILAILTAFALAEIKLVVFIMKKQGTDPVAK